MNVAIVSSEKATIEKGFKTYHKRTIEEVLNEVVIVVANRLDADIVKLVTQKGISFIVLDPNNFETIDDYKVKLTRILESKEVNLTINQF